MLLELRQPPAKQGESVQTVLVNSDKISFIFKPPLHPIFQVAVYGLMLPCIGNYDAALDVCKKLGFVSFDLEDGGTAAINKDHILFFMSPSLGQYQIMFAGNVPMTVKSTLKDITELFVDKPSIVT